jgi:cation:H+ antiporter
VTTYVLPTVLLVLGAVALTAGAEAFAEHIGTAADRLGVSVLALGVLLAGAEPEEAVTAMLASGQGHPALAAGDAIGANLVILTLTLGLAALLRPLPVSRRVVEYAGAAAVAGVLAVLLLRSGVLARAEGALLVLVYAFGVAWVWRRERRPPLVGELAEQAETAAAPGKPAESPGLRAESADPSAAPRVTSAPSRALLMVLVGLLGMVVGGVLAVSGAQGLVDAFGVSESAIGLTVLALATSAEMLALVWAGHRRGVSEVALAGAIGSVAYNATVSLGLAALVGPLAVGQGSPVVRIGMLTAVLPAVLLLGRRTGTLPRWVGPLLLAGYVVTVAWLFGA